MNNIYFYMPPLKKASGGMHVIADLAEHLAKEGKNVFVTGQQELSGELFRSGGAEFLKWTDIKIEKGDYWIVPEGWPNVLAPGLKNGAENIVYVQNWAYLHGNLPEGTFWRDLPVKFWAVSEPVAQFVKDTTGQDAPIIRPAIDTDLFFPPDKKTNLAKGERPVIAWMPRKNPALARQIRDILEARLNLSGLPLPKWLEISGKPHREVAELMRKAHIFLATGFPEGCPLPPLEAMASGLLVVGFAGYGGWDYMSPRHDFKYDGGQVDFRNGFFCADADTYAAAKALENAIKTLARNEKEAERIRKNAISTAARYSREEQRKSLLSQFS